MFNASTYIPAVKFVTTTHNGESTTIDLMKPGVSLGLDILQLIKERMPGADWPAYFDIDRHSKMMQKYREGEPFAREYVELEILDRALLEMGSIIAGVVLSGKSALDGGTGLTPDGHARLDRVGATLQLLKETGYPLDLDEFSRQVAYIAAALKTDDDCLRAIAAPVTAYA